MYNECGMTSRQSVSSRLYVVMEDSSAHAAGASEKVWQSFPEWRGPSVEQTSWLSRDLLPPCLLAADVPCASPGKVPRSCGHSGMCWQQRGLAACLIPAWSTQPRSHAPWHLTRASCNPQGTGKDIPAFATS